MINYKNRITVQKKSTISVYMQVCNQIIQLIREGVLKRNTKLPGTRRLSEDLGVHRKTIVSAYDELYAQGWISVKASEGTFVSDAIPEIDLKPSGFNRKKNNLISGFSLKENKILNTNTYKRTPFLELNDGLPDVRLAPMDSLARSMRSVLKGERGKLSLSYNDIEGNVNLRDAVCSYLNETRGFENKVENIFITRGTIMGLFLSLSVLVDKGDNVVVGNPGYRAVNMIIQNLGGNIVSVPIDDHGLIVEEIDKICKRKKIRAIYVTPHHHYPTTVTMPPERRLKLVALAEKYRIAIIEDDYDYDYHFTHSPFLPLATTDQAGMVIYIGSFTKTFSPAFRVGYLVAPQNFIKEISKLRRIIDRQGDSVMEHAIAEMFRLGEIQNHLRRSHSIYKDRRDYFCEKITDEFKEEIQFITPEGGMAIWANFDVKISLPSLAKEAFSRGLYISDGSVFGLNSTRLGYASVDTEEIDQALDILRKSIKKVKVSYRK